MHLRTFGNDVSNIRLGKKTSRVLKKTVSVSEEPKNPLEEYLPRIKEFWQSNVHQAEAGYFDSQFSLTEKMRSVLVDWLVDVCKKFKLKEETLFLAINILDRYMEKKQVPRDQLQLVGVTCVMIAAKYEEIYPPEAQEFANVTANTYLKEEVVKTEIKILSTLKFRITTTSPFKLLHKNNNKFPKDFERCVLYLLELSLLDVNYLRYTPEEMLQACIMLSFKICSHLLISGFERVEKSQNSKKLAKEMLQLAKKSLPYYATKRKYPSESVRFQMMNEIEG